MTLPEDQRQKRREQNRRERDALRSGHSPLVVDARAALAISERIYDITDRGWRRRKDLEVKFIESQIPDEVVDGTIRTISNIAPTVFNP